MYGISLPLLVVTVRASHLVATVLFDERMLALVAIPDQRCRHGFLDNMPDCELLVLPGFFAA